jgi:phosphoglycolate phosphatase-like HAD superfamily hydrolase
MNIKDANSIQSSSKNSLHKTGGTQMSQTDNKENIVFDNVIFDFDGVLVDSMLVLAKFLAATFRISQERALSMVFRSTLKNSSNRFLPQVRKYFGKRFYQYLENYNKLIDLTFMHHNGVLEDLDNIPQPKYLLTSNYKQVCELFLGEVAENFQDIVGFESVRNKGEGVKHLAAKYNLDLSRTMFITDTVGDIREFMPLVPKENIYGVIWGYHPLSLLEEYLPREQILNNYSDIAYVCQKYSQSHLSDTNGDSGHISDGQQH